MEILIESLKEMWENIIRMTPRILIAFIVFFIFHWIGRILGKIIVRVFARGKFKAVHRNFFRSLTVWVMSILGIIIAFGMIGLEGVAASLLAGGGVTAIILGFAFREIGENFLAGFFLAFSRPFEVGHLIQSGDLQGIVRSVEMRSTHIRTADGRDIYIPSSQIFKDPLVNYTQDGLRRLSFEVGIDYQDDSRKARRVLWEKTKKVDMVLDDPPVMVNIKSMEPNFVLLEVAFWVDTFQEGLNMINVKNEVMDACRKVLEEEKFTFSSNVINSISVVDFPSNQGLQRTSS